MRPGSASSGAAPRLPRDGAFRTVEAVSYFDHNATSPLSAAAREAWLRANDEVWQNPSSPHRAGARARIRLDAERKKLAEVLDVDPDRLIFTGGATEAASAVIAHFARTLPADARIVVNPTEHPCVLEAVRASFEPQRIAWLPITANGVVTPKAVTEMCHSISDTGSGRVGAVVVMAANNETGVLQPWTELAEVCRQERVPFVCDASQWLGKLPAGGLGEADWSFGAAHKFGGPKGVGFLQRAADASGFSIRPGGGQQRGHRGGTEDLPGIVAMVAALRDAEQTKVLHEDERLRWREQFERDLLTSIPGVRVVAAEVERLWNTVSLLLPHGENTRWVARLDQRGFAVSTGSACATGKEGPSHVLAAMGLSPEEAKRVIRISAGWDTTQENWTALRDALVAVSTEVRPANNVISI